MYFYCVGHMGLSLLREDTVLDMLGLAHQFNFQELEQAISDYLRQVLALRNVCAVLDAARYDIYCYLGAVEVTGVSRYSVHQGSIRKK